jgi:hypothetical protein
MKTTKLEERIAQIILRLALRPESPSFAALLQSNGDGALLKLASMRARCEGNLRTGVVADVLIGSSVDVRREVFQIVATRLVDIAPLDLVTLRRACECIGPAPIDRLVRDAYAIGRRSLQRLAKLGLVVVDDHDDTVRATLAGRTVARLSRRKR